MKLTLVLTMLFLLNANANTYSQGAKLDISIKQATLKELFEQIKSKSGYKFLYNNDLVNDELRIDVNIKRGSIEEILTEPLKQSNLTFKVIDKQIIVYPAAAIEEPGVQPRANMIKGVVSDSSGAPLPGATVTIVGTTRGVITDVDGTYTIEVNPGDKLVFSFIGMESQIVDVSNQKTINIQLKEKAQELEDVTVVAFGKQKKESVIGSISTVRPSELKVPSSNLTTALAGLSGIVSYQRSGEPGQDNAEFFIRGVTTFGYKKDPLILIDNIELTKDDLARLQPDDIASFSIMKDATAAALYGARGANGVILVTTKEGKEGKAKFSFRFENSFSSATDRVELADPITYMKLNNEAVRTRNSLEPLPFSELQIENAQAGKDPYLYPTVDWYNTLFKDQTTNQRFNFNVSGGEKVARYYLAGTYTNDNGNLRVPQVNDFNNNINLKRYTLRSNVNINLTPTTEVALRFNGSFDDYSGPLYGGQDLYRRVMRANPALFAPYYPPDAAHAYTRHILFGNYGTNATYLNPYADMVKGYKDYSNTVILAQIELRQNLDVITKGLSCRIQLHTDRNSFFDIQRKYEPYYYQIFLVDPVTNTTMLSALNETTGREELDYTESQKTVSIATYLEGALDYNKIFNEKHAVSGLFVYTMRNSLIGNPGDLQKSLPYRNIGFAGRFTYAYDNRYLSEINFGYNGSERFSKDKRFGFFPAVGVGWIVSNESFWGPLEKVISKLKFKATYGLVGNDAIGSDADRFFYLSNVNLNNTSKGMSFGTLFDYTRPGVSISRYANNDITWETSKKMDLGLECELFSKLELQVYYFTEHRDNILMDRIQPSTLGLQAQSRANLGAASNKGIDISLDYKQFFKKDFWITGRANFTFARGVFEKYEEPDYSVTPWLSRVGQPLKQQYGLIAERLFIDEDDINNSPLQSFGDYKPGDIKYRDINNDGVINGIDMVPIGYPTDPEIVYSIGISTGYKAFDFSCFFQGSARQSFWLDVDATAPFISYRYSNDPSELSSKTLQNQLLKVYADSHWSEENKNQYAIWPRLSSTPVRNNTQVSTWFMQNGAFLRLKSIELGYTVPQKLASKMKADRIRIYVNGLNMFVFSPFKLWDPEMAGNGLGYPLQKVLNLGIMMSF
jgi:TonB-linked SusC/RagA family outer membrane protein